MNLYYNFEDEETPKNRERGFHGINPFSCQVKSYSNIPKYPDPQKKASVYSTGRIESSAGIQRLLIILTRLQVYAFILWGGVNYTNNANQISYKSAVLP